jgi:hypothetical protein
MAEVLQSVLDQSLLESLKSDEDFQNLEDAAQDLSGSLLEDHTVLLSSTLSVLDPNVSEDDPSLKRAEEAIKTHWKTFRNRFHDGAAFALRVVVFEALAQACEDNSDAAATIWYAGGTRFRQADQGGIGNILEQLFTSAGEKKEATTHELWSFPSEPEIDTIPNIKFDEPEVSRSKIDKNALAKGLQSAVVPQDVNGNQLGRQSHWPHNNTNHTRNWGQEFAKYAAETITKTIDDIDTFDSSEMRERLKSALRSHSQSVGHVVREALRDVFATMRTQRRRTDLMWWMRTKYSPLLRRSYRELSLPMLLMTMALDLHRQVPLFTPQSVEYLLREYVHEMEKGDEALTVYKLVEDLSSNDLPSPLVSTLEDAIPNRDGRLTIPAFVSGVLGDRFTLSKLEDHVGPLRSVEVPASELAVWIFRDLQAERLAASS